MIKLTNTNITISLLILVCMSVLCHLSNFLYPKERFLDPNTLYSRDNNCFRTHNPVYSTHFQQQQQERNRNCGTRHRDPCSDVLEQQHFQIPGDVMAQCTNSNNPSVSSEDLEQYPEIELTEEEFQKLLKLYAMSESRRLPTYPWFS